MNCFAVHTKRTRSTGTVVWFPIQTEMSLAQLMDAFKRDGMVIVTRLHGWNQENTYIYNRAHDMILTRDAFATIFPMDKTVVEDPDGVERG